MPYESLQKKLNRIRPPQVHITYDVEVGSTIEKREVPFVAGVMADLSGKPEEPLPRLRERKFVQIDRDNFDHVLERIRPRLQFSVRSRLQEDSGELPMTLSFRSLADFSPEALASQVPALSELLSIRDKLTNLQTALFGNDKLDGVLQDILVHQELLENVVRDFEALKNPLSSSTRSETVEELFNAARVKHTAEDRAAAAVWLGDFLAQASQGQVVISRDTESIVNARLAAIDHAISRQTDEIMHHPDFQRLEASWRSLWYLVDQTETSERLRIRVLNVSKNELLKDLTRAVEFDQSVIFKKVYEEEYGTLGGSPFALLIGDYYFDRDTRDITFLDKMIQVAAAAHAPFIAGVGPQMFNLDSFSELTLPRDLSKIFDAAGYAAWRYFRQNETSRFAGLVLPRMLLRLPYGSDTVPVERFAYQEQITEHEHYLWGNAAIALGVRVMDSFARYGWYAAIRGVEGGGLITGLPAHQFSTDEGELVLKCPTEIAITDRRESELVRLGFIPLLHVKDTDSAVFLSVPSCHKPRSTSDQTEAASSSLDVILAVGRFTHYLRCLMRDKIGFFLSVQDCEQYLNQWLTTYVLAEEKPSTDKSKTPLKYGMVQVAEIVGKPGAYRATLEIQPFFQFADLAQPLRAMVTLPTVRYL